MKTVKLSSVDGFVLIDLENAPTSVGLVRSAPKILVGGAEMLARSVTYAFAAFEVKAGGASAGVNAKPDGRSEAVQKFAAEVATDHPSVILDAGKGVEPGDLDALRAADPRPAALREETEAVTGADDLLASGALAAATAVGGDLSGSKVAIEGFGPVGLALARQAAASGATVVAIGTGAGTALEPAGFDPAALAEGWTESGEAMAKSLGADQQPAWAVWGSDADVVFCGSKAGAMNHEGAAHVKARTVVPIGAAPITTKSLAVLGRAGVVYVPDFLSTAAPLLVGTGDIPAEAATARITEVTSELGGHADGLFLGACERAEKFLRTWQDTLPFGRPLG